MCFCGVFCNYLLSTIDVGCQIMLMFFSICFLSRWLVYQRKWVLKPPTLMLICVFKSSSTFPPWNLLPKILGAHMLRIVMSLWLSVPPHFCWLVLVWLWGPWRKATSEEAKWHEAFLHHWQGYPRQRSREHSPSSHCFSFKRQKLQLWEVHTKAAKDIHRKEASLVYRVINLAVHLLGWSYNLEVKDSLNRNVCLV